MALIIDLVHRFVNGLFQIFYLQASPHRRGGLKGRRGCIFEPACENPVTCTVIQKVTSQSAALTALL